MLSSLGFGLLLIGFVVFYTSIAIHNTSGFLIDFVHTEQAVHPSQSVPSETFGLVRQCLLAILTIVRGFQVSYFRPYWDERIIIYTLKKFSSVRTLQNFLYSINIIIYQGSQMKRRYGQVVRQWIANPLSPVRTWVSPTF